MDTPGHPFSGKLRAVNSHPHAPGAAPAPPSAAAPATVTDGAPVSVSSAPVREVGGREGLEPTRYGDWELRGRCIDF
jgi:hypothetical protein